MRLLLVRHGQSENNLVHERIMPMLKRGELTVTEAEHMWMQQRCEGRSLLTLTQPSLMQGGRP